MQDKENMDIALVVIGYVLLMAFVFRTYYICAKYKKRLIDEVETEQQKATEQEATPKEEK